MNAITKYLCSDVSSYDDDDDDDTSSEDIIDCEEVARYAGMIKSQLEMDDFLRVCVYK